MSGAGGHSDRVQLSGHSPPSRPTPRVWSRPDGGQRGCQEETSSRYIIRPDCPPLHFIEADLFRKEVANKYDRAEDTEPLFGL